MSALSKIENAGFDLVLTDSGFDIAPFNKLTDKQIEFLKTSKTEIIAELKARQIIKKLVTCWTPAGNPIQVEADSESHAEWLKLVNPHSQSVRSKQTDDIVFSSFEDDKKLIVEWLHSIGEYDPATINEVLVNCENNPVAKAYFLGRRECSENKQNYC
jgi:hypothetical protein